MEPVKYFYESYDNRKLEDEEKGYALLAPIPASEKSMLTNHLVAASLRDKKKVEVDMGGVSFKMNKKYVKGIYNVKDPLTEEVHAELTIDDLYNKGQFSDLYEEISNAVGDVSKLREGLKKS